MIRTTLNNGTVALWYSNTPMIEILQKLEGGGIYVIFRCMFHQNMCGTR